MENLKENTVKGVAWSAVDRVANGGIQFLANVMLARILSPDDFGLIAVIAIFIQISQVFIDSGFSNALIQHFMSLIRSSFFLCPPHSIIFQE